MLWKIIYRTPNFFGGLKMMKDAEHLWAYAKQYDPVFLTGLPMQSGAKDQKIRWVQEKFGHQYVTHVLPKRDKQLHSGPNKLLVDDTPTNLTQWAEKGGLVVHHVGDVWATIDAMEELRKGYES